MILIGVFIGGGKVEIICLNEFELEFIGIVLVIFILY